MNVLLVSMVYPHPRAGFWPGIERQVGDFAVALGEAGARVRVITSFRNGGPAHEVHRGVEIFRVTDPVHRWGRLGYVGNRHVSQFGAQALRLSRLFEEADIVESFVPLPRSRTLTRPGLSLFAFFAHRDRPSRWTDYLHQPLYHRMERKFYRRVHRVFVASGESRRVLIEEYGVEASRIEVIPLGVSSRFLAGLSEAPARAADDGPVRLLYVGPLLPRKGLRTLVEALPLVAREHPGFRVVIAGKGPEKAPLEAMASRLGVGDRVEFPGFIPELDLPRLYRQADLFVFPSLKEGFGLVLVEAMASGLPIVAADVPPIPEVAGEAALLFPARDAAGLARAIGRAIGDPQLRRRLGEAGESRVKQRYDWGRIAQQTLEVYRGAAA